MRKNEHPRCGCKACRRGAGRGWGQFVHRAVNRAIRHRTKEALRKHLDLFEQVLVSTPMTD